MRRARRICAIWLILAGTLVLAARLYLGSAHAAAQVRDKLAAVYGGPVALESVDIGFSRSELQGLQLFEVGHGVPETPWASASAVGASLSLWDILRGQTTPESVTLTGAAITLRFDAAGHLITRFPESKPGTATFDVITLRGGRVTLKQEGRPDLVVTDVDAELRPEGSRLVLSGTAIEPRWGTWNAAGSWDRETNQWSLHLTTPHAVFTQAQLDTLPFVSDSVWQQVRLDGSASVDLTIRRDDQMHYRIALSIDDAKVHVPAIDLHTTQTRGRVLIDDKLVTLSDVQGRSADGDICTDGDLDFRGVPSVMHFNIAVERLQLAGLPKSWFTRGGLMVHLLEGRLSGWADLEIKIVNGHAEPSGVGQGNLKVAGRERKFPLELHADGKHFRFRLAPLLRNARLPADNTTRLAADVTLGESDLGDLLPPALPLPVEGRVSAEVHVELPLEHADDPRNYRLQATVRLPWLRVAGVEVRDVLARIDGADGVLHVTELSGRVPERTPPACGPPADGTFTASARCELFPAGRLTARLCLDHLPLTQLLNLLPVTGNISTNLDLAVPVARLAEANAWTATGRVEGDVTARGWHVRDAGGNVQLRDGRINLTELQGRILNALVQGSAGVSLTTPCQYTGRLEVNDAGAAVLERLAETAGLPALTGHIGATAELRGALRPFALCASGNVTASELVIGKARIDTLRFRWEEDADRLHVFDIQGDLYQGEITGEAHFPRGGIGSGDVDLLCTDIDLDRVSREFPVRLFGSLSGTVRGTVTPAPNLQVEMRAPRLRVQDLPTEHLKGTLTYCNGVAGYDLAGDILGGRYHLDGRLSRDDPRPAGKLRVNDVRLWRVWEYLTIPGLDLFRGRLNLDLAYGSDGPDGKSRAEGQLVVQRLRWEHSELADTIQADVTLDREALRLRNLNGSVGRGLLRGQGSFHFRPPVRSSLDLSLDGADAGQLLAPCPHIAALVEGNLDVRVRSQLDGEFNGSGSVVMPRGAVAGMEVLDWRVPFEFSCVPGEGRGRVDVRETTAQAARGRVVGRGSFAWGAGPRLEGSLRFFNVDLRTLLHWADNSTVGTGQLSGRLDFDGPSIADMGATLDANLQQAQALEFPVLRQLTPYVAPGQSSALFQDGEVQARLSRGVVRVQRLQLVGSLVQLFAEGTVTLAGQLNLEVTAATGRLTAVVGTLAGRLAHLHVGGNVRNPSVTVVPPVDLSEDALRFLLGGIGGNTRR